MKLAAVVVVLVGTLLGACVAESDAPMPDTDRSESAALEIDGVEQDANAQLCAMAAELPADDMCSLICDPDAFAARLTEDGMKGGNCYQFRCAVSIDVSVSVGVCLP
ncbi:MAG: hypothetical protein H0T89_04195 [Deltaproteobacteria bacterium]|nr:hypothetical protein [Deltaproteobacteria bacterium]MDQ3297247.1 hypothetical protein [Myxococcota bacterium]